MDTELWGKLPEDILPHILSRLPWWSMMKCRVVSKQWQSLLSDPIFLKIAVSSPGALDPPCCVLSNHKFYYVIINPDTQRCHAIPRDNMFPLQHHPEANRFQLHGTAGGLFLMQVAFQCRDRYLFNPLNGTQRLLPAVPPSPLLVLDSPWTKLHQPKTWMMVDDSGHLRLICLQVRETPVGNPELVLWTVHTYDFVENGWRLHSTDLPGKRLEFCISATLLEGNVYLLVKTPVLFTGTGLTHRLFKAYARHMVEMSIKFTDGISALQIFQYQGALMLMAGTEEPRKPPFHVSIWKYDEILESWENVVSMPQDIVDTFYEEMSAEGGFYFDKEGDVCCFANRLDSEFIVMYHFVRNEWWHVSCSETVVDEFEKMKVVCRLTFLWQPRLDIFL